VQNIIHSAASVVNRLKIEQVRFLEVNAMRDFSQILAPAGRKVINSTHLVALRKYRARQRRSDEASNSSN